MAVAWGVLVVTSAVASARDATGSPAEFSDADLEFFERQVRPLLVTHCHECHGADEASGSLRLTSRQAILRGGDTGPAIVAGDPEQSLLVDAISYGDLYQMPPKSKLPPAAIQTLIEWVRRGAPWPDDKAGEDLRANGEAFDLEARKAAHWSWQPIVDPPLPGVRETHWPSDPLDYFILAPLESAGITPAPDADPGTLLRRAYFDLTGLPPPSAAVEAFLADPSAASYVEVVDRLLASPQFGEHWARHWLDLMRYAETRGHEFDYPTPNAWQYRDYVIRAFNQDVPYDQFVTEHLAGDLVDPPRRHPTEGFNESVIATGFWYLGDWVHSPVDIRKDETDRFDNAIDVYSKAFLGLTVACARCHDHKFDAISQADYYALAGFLQSSAYRQVRFESAEHNAEVARQIDTLRRTTGRQLAERVAQAVSAAHDRTPRLLSTSAALVAAEKEAAPADNLVSAAARLGVPDTVLAAWLETVQQARSDASHPLHAIVLAALSGIESGGQPLQPQPDQARPPGPPEFRVVVDYDSSSAAWLTDGPAFGAGPLRAGSVLPNLAADGPLVEIVARGRAQRDPQLSDLKLRPATERPSWAASDWSDRPGRVLRTPTVTLTDGKLYYLMRGGAQIHAVVDSHHQVGGPLHRTLLLEVPEENQLRWVEHDLSRYRGHAVHVEIGVRETDLIQVHMVVQGARPPQPPETWYPGDASPGYQPPQRTSELIAQLGARLGESLASLAEDRWGQDPGAARLAEWAMNHPELWSPDLRSELDHLAADYRERRQLLLTRLQRISATAPAIQDGTGEDERLLIRGNAATPGDLVPRRMLTAIAGTNQPQPTSGSGRLELARRTLDPRNPFPARVMANRIWHHLMGRGIVPTVDNFGVLGQAPSHPELLDHLASRFVREGWSVKGLIRAVMLSRTYRMSSQLRPAAEAVDPQNLLWHRMPIRRLSAEAIRDAMLALSGRLDPTQYGPGVPIYLTDFMQGRGRPEKSGPLDGDGRRSIYQVVRRNFLSPMMLAFDTPQPSSPRGDRTQSNVPAQALILMNDPFVIAQARQFAERLCQSQPDVDRRLEQLYLEAFARPPNPQEAELVKHFCSVQQNALASSPESVADPADAQGLLWGDLCHVLFNTKEFIFLR
jgi:cytochrome c553